MDRLKDKMVLITGSAGGIGDATARLMIKEGARVVVADIDDSNGKRKAEALGINAVYMHLDVRMERDWMDVTQRIEMQHGHLDVLVNNAGISGSLHEAVALDPENTSLESFRDIQATNVEGTMLGCKYAIKLMKKKGGSIVNISSRSGLVGRSNRVGYGTSKAGILNMTKTVALYCAEEGYSIRCNSVHPATILTSIWDPVLGTGAERKENIEKLSRNVPMGRFGKPEEVAQTILFLASDESSYITGTSIVVDGGLLAGG